MGVVRALLITAVASLAVAAPASAAGGVFAPTNPMSTARYAPAAAPLPDGRVLVVGGVDPSVFLSSAEIYDPSTGTFSPANPMATTRAGAAAAPLPDGRVLVVGGSDSSGRLSSAEVYDPSTGTFTPTNPARMVRAGAAAAPLPDGRVLVVGGNDSISYYSSAEVYDPSTGNFTATNPMATARFEAAAAPLPGGRVLVVGGFDSSGPLDSGELYLSPPSIASPGADFGPQAVGTSVTRPLTITNRGAQRLRVSAARLGGGDAADFGIAANGCADKSLGYGESCEVTVSFVPSRGGDRSASVSIDSNAESSPDSFPLRGTGTAPAGTVAPPSTPGAATPDAATARGRARAGRVVTVKGRTALLALACRGPRECAGTARLTVRAKAKRKRSAKAAAAKPKRKAITIGRTTFKLAAGGRGTVKARLTSKGKALLAAAGHAGLEARLGGNGVIARAVTLRKRAARDNGHR